MTERAPEMARLFLARVAFGTERLIVCGKRLALVEAKHLGTLLTGLPLELKLY
jgi:hypothetical protein